MCNNNDDTRALFLRCPHCESLFPLSPPNGECRHDEAAHGCPLPLPAACYTCGAAPQLTPFSATQLARLSEGAPARCAACVAAGVSGRFVRSSATRPLSVSELLTEAVQEGDVSRVRALLDEPGVDVNHARQHEVLVNGSWLPAFLSDGTPAPELDPTHIQPTTPLKLVSFRLSDCTLSENGAWAFKEIGDLLIARGADARAALAHMEGRYGAFTPGGEDADALQATFAAVHRASSQQ